ncbi:uncharacterized protein LOC106804280 [Setaria italica]|uniref:uncharacterized protein LOC106804280 n=1 Tax=Setaria italica TaxID=4555 RepID=UPI0007199E0B|nr:uncharacterized protein LOC106804280 [Setaria italica]
MDRGEPIAKVTSAAVVKLFLDIVYRFGVPNSIITDNGTQFTGRKFLRFCDDYHVMVDWASVSHSHTNGQVKRANGMVLQGLKPCIFDRLKKFMGRWAREVHRLHTLLHGIRHEAVLPTDLNYGAPRVKAYNEARLEGACQDALD